MHYRQPWVCAVEEELGIINRRVEKYEEHKSLVVKLEVQNKELKVSCFLSLFRIKVMSIIQNLKFYF